jgi:hypothetical protein
MRMRIYSILHSKYFEIHASVSLVVITYKHKKGKIPYSSASSPLDITQKSNLP